MPKTKIVMKHRKMLNESDRHFILSFFKDYFDSKEIIDIYIEEESCPQVDS